MRSGLKIICVLAIVSSIALGCVHVSAESYCERLDELKQFPFYSDQSVDDEIYNGLRKEGRKAIACLLKKVTDLQVMPDPRQAPPISSFTVGDAATIVLLDICDLSMEEVLPSSVSESWEDKGVYAYFEFVEQGVENRRLIVEELQKKGCN